MAEKKVKNLPPQELAVFFESFRMLLDAGVSANECPDIIAGDTEGTKLGDAAKEVDAILNSGDVFILSEALEKSGYFPEYSVEMMRLGEESGRMETTSQSLGQYYSQQQALNNSVKSAITGPLLLLVMMSVVLLFLIFFVLPVFENVFNSLGVATSGGLGGAFAAAKISMVVVGILVLVVLVCAIMYFLPGGRARMLNFAESFPLTRRIHYTISASRFTNGLAMLLASGISTSEALEKAGKLVENKKIASKLPQALKEVNEGEDLGKTLVANGVLSGFEAKILLSAARAGQTEVAMRKLSDIYTEETTAGIEKLLGLIEPALVGILSAAIGIILLSVMLPLTNIMSAIN